MTDSEKLAFLIRYNCPVWMDGYDEHAKRQRYLLKTRSWTFAQARLIEVEQGHIPAPRPTAQTPSVETAIASYLDDCRARRLQPSTITSYTKTLEHLSAAVNLYMAFFNFCRVHKTLRVTPAMQAGIADHVWTIQEFLT